MAEDEIGVGEVLLLLVSFFTSLVVVLIFIVIGWYIVWVAFLSRFKLMRELLSVSDEDRPREKRTAPDDQVPRPTQGLTATPDEEEEGDGMMEMVPPERPSSGRTRKRVGQVSS